MEPVNDGTAPDHAADAPARGAREWHAPQLTVLGDVRSLTEAGGAAVPDGGGNFSS